MNYKKLHEIYKKIPSIDCRGLCHHTCTTIYASKIEIKRARNEMNGKNPFSLTNKCKALKDEKCSIYSSRPAICRLYGVTETLECHFGCKPKEKLNKEEAYAIIREIERL